MQGYLGTPEGGWPKVLQKIILDSAGVKPIKGRPGAKLPKVDFAAIAEGAGREDRAASRARRMCCRTCCIRRSFSITTSTSQKYDNTSVIPTPAFFYGLQSGEEISVEIEPGKTLIVKYLTTGEPHEDGTRTVFFELNGQPREVNVAGPIARSGSCTSIPRPTRTIPNHVAAPMPGKVSTVAVKKGQAVKDGERLLSIEAMKMETAVYSPRDAKVADVLVKPGSTIQARDLLVVLE